MSRHRRLPFVTKGELIFVAIYVIVGYSLLKYFLGQSSMQAELNGASQ